MNNAFVLPFNAVHPRYPFFSSGTDVTMSIQVQRNLLAKAECRIHRVIERFVAFASKGFLAGANIPPPESGLKLVVQTNRSLLRVDTVLENCRVDDAAFVVLCDLLLHKDVASLVHTLEVSCTAPSQRLIQDPTVQSHYPAIFAALPFLLIDEDPEGGGYLFRVEMHRPPSDRVQHDLRALVDLWSRTVLAGAFALAPIPPEENYLEPEAPVFFDCTFEWSIGKLRAHPACLSALVNAVAALHPRAQVVSLTITQ